MKNFKHTHFVFSFLTAIFILINPACKKDILVEEIVLTPINKIDISGFIVDEEGRAIADARVEIDGTVVYTDTIGYFMIKGVKVTNNKINIIAEKDGFYQYQELNLELQSESLILKIKLEKINTLNAKQ